MKKYIQVCSVFIVTAVLMFIITGCNNLKDRGGFPKFNIVQNYDSNYTTSGMYCHKIIFGQYKDLHTAEAVKKLFDKADIYNDLKKIKLAKIRIPASALPVANYIVFNQPPPKKLKPDPVDKERWADFFVSPDYTADSNFMRIFKLLFQTGISIKIDTEHYYQVKIYDSDDMNALKILKKHGLNRGLFEPKMQYFEDYERRVKTTMPKFLEKIKNDYQNAP